MRGRTIFKIIAPLLYLVYIIFRLLPAFVSGFFMALFRYIPSRLGVAIRYPLVRRLAKRCGKVVAVFDSVYLFGLRNMEFGDNVSVQPMCYIDASGGLKIGSDVSIAHGTTIMTTDHDYSKPDQNIRDAPVIMAPVLIGNNVWIGAGARILAGVSIGENVVIGAGAVVTKDIPSFTIFAGVPAQQIKALKD